MAVGFERKVGREGIWAREPNLVEGRMMGLRPDAEIVFSVVAGQGVFLLLFLL